MLCSTSPVPRALSETPEFSGHVRRTKKIRDGKDAKPTAWYEDRSPQALQAPPPAYELPGAERGDIFFHNASAESKFWILRQRDDQLVWESIPLGYRRSDGRRLSLTKTRGEPSWICDAWYKKRSAGSKPETASAVPSASRTRAAKKDPSPKREGRKTSLAEAEAPSTEEEEAQETSCESDGAESYVASSSSE